MYREKSGELAYLSLAQGGRNHSCLVRTMACDTGKEAIRHGPTTSER